MVISGRVIRQQIKHAAALSRLALYQ